MHIQISKRQFENVVIPVLNKAIKIRNKAPVVIGIQGGQGTGKTTLAKNIAECMDSLGFRVCSFSIDDFYKTYKQRKALSRKLKDNPFYQIPRGLPGTHRVGYLQRTLENIKNGRKFSIPVFDKSKHNASGDVLKKRIKFDETPDFVLFEGWCIGIRKISVKKLADVCRRYRVPLKKTDPDLEYSKEVLERAEEYGRLWEYIDYLIMLKPQSRELHKKWRYEQEKELRKRTGKGMTKKEIYDFVEIYLPFTYLCYDMIKPDTRIAIDKNHRFSIKAGSN